MKKEVVLVINPGSTSTKLALFTREGPVCEESIDHTGTDICNMNLINNQLPLRMKIIDETCRPWLENYDLVAVVGRGGLLKPMKSGIYEINSAMVDDLSSCRYGSHAGNLGAPIAYELSRIFSVPSYILDPIVTNEFIPEACISGVPEIERKCRAHVLNIKACVRKEADKLGKKIEDTNFIVAHLGGGISIGALKGGRLIDVNDASLGMGPFSPERAGALPINGILDLAMSGDFTRDQLINKFTKESGLKGYLGTNDVREVLRRIDEGDKKAALIFRAMIFQISKEIGAMAAVLKGNLDGVILTGGLANSLKIVEQIAEQIKFLGNVALYPGENELEAMAAGGFRAIDGTEEVMFYEKE